MMTASSKGRIFPSLALVLMAFALLGTSPGVRANTYFATQTGQSCATCHVTGTYNNNPPVLTDFGRRFKDAGYRMAQPAGAAPVAPAPATATPAPVAPAVAAPTAAPAAAASGRKYIGRVRNCSPDIMAFEYFLDGASAFKFSVAANSLSTDKDVPAGAYEVRIFRSGKFFRTEKQQISADGWSLNFSCQQMNSVGYGINVAGQVTSKCDKIVQLEFMREGKVAYKYRVDPSARGSETIVTGAYDVKVSMWHPETRSPFADPSCKSNCLRSRDPKGTVVPGKWEVLGTKRDWHAREGNRWEFQQDCKKISG